ncbi:MAG TPA: twin-arginine translocase TatA/TatE family subunit [Flavipsychrobacter sp.]|nr:twin-arginine translocase TatA/TatE family subunit [Flavipsychrobacter sp.]
MMNMENTQLLFAAPGGMELIMILLIVILLFGAKKIPELAKGLGKGIKEFKDAKEEGMNPTTEVKES